MGEIDPAGPFSLFVILIITTMTHNGFKTGEPISNVEALITRHKIPFIILGTVLGYFFWTEHLSWFILEIYIVKHCQSLICELKGMFFWFLQCFSLQNKKVNKTILFIWQALYMRILSRLRFFFFSKICRGARAIQKIYTYKIL